MSCKSNYLSCRYHRYFLPEYYSLALYFILSYIGCIIFCPSVGTANNTNRKKDSLQFTARLLHDKVEFGGVIHIELIFENIGNQPISIHPYSAAHCRTDFSCPGRGGNVGETRLPEKETIHKDHWQRIQPSETYRMMVIHDELASECVSKMKITLHFYNDFSMNPPKDYYKGRIQAEPIYVEIVDNFLIREIKLESPNQEIIYNEILRLLKKSRTDLLNELQSKHGSSLVTHFINISVDETLSTSVRARAASYLGGCVYYAPSKSELRKQALPVLKKLVTHPSAAIRAEAIWSLCTADRSRPHLESFDLLIADPVEKVRIRAADYLKWFTDHPQTWPYVKKALQDPSYRVRWQIITARALMYPRSRKDVQLLLECCALANEKDCVRLLKGLDRSVSSRDVPFLITIFDSKPEAIQEKIVRIAGLTLSPKNHELLHKAWATRNEIIINAVLDVIEASGQVQSLLEDNVKLGTEVQQIRARQILSQLASPVGYPEIKKMMSQYSGTQNQALLLQPIRFHKVATGFRLDNAKTGKMLCYIAINIRQLNPNIQDNSIAVRCDLKLKGTLSPKCIPIADEGVEGYWQFILYKNDHVVERGDIENIPIFNRYHIIPFGSIGSMGSCGKLFYFRPKVKTGDYELQLEGRFLCTGLASRDQYNRYNRVITLSSNKIPVSLPIRTNKKTKSKFSDSSLERMAKILSQPDNTKNQTHEIKATDSSKNQTIIIQNASDACKYLKQEGSRAVPFVLKYFDPNKANQYQIHFLKNYQDPLALQAVEKAFLTENKYARESISYLKKSTNPDVTHQIIKIAANEIHTQNWDWMKSREALQCLDHHLNVEYAAYAPVFCEELAARLVNKRDRYVMRGGESIWGAFRTAFFLGQLGDSSALPVLRRAQRTDNLLLRWHAAAAIKLIEIQNRPEKERFPMIEEWLSICFSSPEEHFMARHRLIPYLNQLLKDRAKEFYRKLNLQIEDPWLQYDIDKPINAPD